jgi:hypothetical protein
VCRSTANYTPPVSAGIPADPIPLAQEAGGAQNAPPARFLHPRARGPPHDHPRSILAYCNSPQFTALEAYMQFEKGLITDDGEVTNESTRQFLSEYMSELADFIERVYTVLPRTS